MPITDLHSLQEWLKGRPREDSLCIFTRIALRIFPLWSSQMDRTWARQRNLTSLPVLFLNLASTVALKYKTPEAKEAAAVADSHAASSTNDAGHVLFNMAVSIFHEARDASIGDRTDLAALQIAMFAASAAYLDAGYAAGHAAGSHVSSSGPFAFAQTAVANDIWAELDLDAQLLEGSRNLASIRLWSASPPNWFTPADAKTRAIWAADLPGRWDFWLRWWDGILAGTPLDWDLQRDVALIPDADWQQGPDHIARLISGIEAEHARPASDPVQEALKSLPAAKKAIVAQVQTAVTLNRDALPPTFDAIEGFITLEIQRLQSRNHQSENEVDEARRMIATLCFLHEAILRMQESIPTEGPVSLPQAQQVEKLSRLYAEKLRNLPRDKADEVVDGLWATGKGVLQVGLIGTSATLLMALGLPALAGVAVSTLVFAPKLAPDAIRAAIEIARGQAKP